MRKYVLILIALVAIAFLVASCAETGEAGKALIKEPKPPKETHKECVEGRCKTVQGAGVNQCTNNADCRVPIPEPPPVPDNDTNQTDGGAPPVPPDMPMGDGDYYDVTNITLNDNLGDIMPEFFWHHIPGMLPRGTINNVAYSQSFRFKDWRGADLKAGKLVYEENEDDQVGDFLRFQDADAMFEYGLNFAGAGLPCWVGFDGSISNIVGHEVNILGKTYEFASAGFNDAMISLTLLGGEGGVIEDNLTEGQTGTYTLVGQDYEIVLLYVSEVIPCIAKFSVNGDVSRELTRGRCDRVAGDVNICIKSVTPGSAVWMLGRNRIEFTDSDTLDEAFDNSSDALTVDDETIGAAEVNIKTTDGDNDWIYINYLKYRLEADAAGAGDIYVADAHGLREYLKEPEGMLSTGWDIKYAGFNDVEETMVKVDAAGKKQYLLRVTNNNDVQMSIPYVYSGYGYMKPGSLNKGLYWFERDLDGRSGYITQDDWFIVTDHSSMRYLEFTDYDTDDNTLEFSDGDDAYTVTYTGTVTIPGSASGVLNLGGKEWLIHAFYDGTNMRLTTQNYYVNSYIYLGAPVGYPFSEGLTVTTVRFTDYDIDDNTLEFTTLVTGSAYTVTYTGTETVAGGASGELCIGGKCWTVYPYYSGTTMTLTFKVGLRDDWIAFKEEIDPDAITYGVQFTDYDIDDNTLEFSDGGDAYTLTWTGNVNSPNCNANGQLNLGGKEWYVYPCYDGTFMNISVDHDGDGSVNSREHARVVVKSGGVIDLCADCIGSESMGDFRLAFTSSAEKHLKWWGGDERFYVNIGIGPDDNLTLSVPDDRTVGLDMSQDEANDQYAYGMTNYGNKLTERAATAIDSKELTIHHPFIQRAATMRIGLCDDEEWQCGPWSNVNQQCGTRTCTQVNDLCGDTAVNMPETTKECPDLPPGTGSPVFKKGDIVI